MNHGSSHSNFCHPEQQSGIRGGWERIIGRPGANAIEFWRVLRSTDKSSHSTPVPLEGTEKARVANTDARRKDYLMVLASERTRRLKLAAVPHCHFIASNLELERLGWKFLWSLGPLKFGADVIKNRLNFHSEMGIWVEPAVVMSRSWLPQCFDWPLTPSSSG